MASSGRGALQRDVEGYVIAACLSDQEQPYLKEQGEGWALVIVERGKADLDTLAGLAKAVKEELAKGHVPIIRNGDRPVIHNDHESGPDMAAPVLYCGEIIDAPEVRKAIIKAMKKLFPAYHRRR